MFQVGSVGDTRILRHRGLPPSVRQPGEEVYVVASDCMCQVEAGDKGGRLPRDQVKRVFKTRLMGLYLFQWQERIIRDLGLRR